MKFAKDNSVYDLDKVIKYHKAELNDLNKYFDIWINHLLLTEDSYLIQLNYVNFLT